MHHALTNNLSLQINEICR